MPSRFLRIPILPLPFGLRTQKHPFLTSGNVQMENWWRSPDEPNAIEVIPGAQDALGSGEIGGGGISIRTLGYGESKDLERFVYASGSTKVWSINQTGTVTELKTGLTANLKFSIVNYGNNAYFFNGTDAPFKHANYSSVADVGPGTAPVVTSVTFAGAGAGPLTGTYYWWVAYERTDSGGAVSQSPLSEKIGPFAGKDKAAQLASVPVDPSPPPGGSSRRLIFRSVAGGPDPFLSGIIDDNVTTTFTDSTADVELSNEPELQGGEAPPTKCSFAVVHFNRIWASGDDDAPSKVYHSALGNGDDWSSDRWFLDVWQNDGDRVSALGAFPGGIVVWKHHHLYMAVGQDPEAQIMDIQQLVPADQNYRTVGTPSHWSVAATPAGFFFYYQRAFWLLDMSGTVTRISSDQIEDELRDDISVGSEKWIQSAYHPEYDVVLCSVPIGGSTLPQRTYIWHRDSGTFSRMSYGFPAMAMVERGTDGSEPSSQELWATWNRSPTDSTILKILDSSVNTFDGTTVTATLQLPPIYLSSPGQLALWRNADLTFGQAAGGTLTFKFGISGSSTTSATINMSETGVTRVTRGVGITQHGEDLDLYVVSNQSGTRPKLYSLNVYARPGGDQQNVP